MERIKIILFFILITTTSFSQKGVWICTDQQAIDSLKKANFSYTGAIIDFDSNTYHSIYKDTVIELKVDKKKQKITTVTSDDWFIYTLHQNESIIINDISDNLYRSFVQLPLDKPLDKGYNEILSILTTNTFEEIDNLSFSFSTKKTNLVVKRYDFVHDFFEDKSLGGWFLKEFKGNFFIGISIAPDITGYHIFQITKIDHNKIYLNLILNDGEYEFNIKELVFSD